ncbi:MAG: CvpA family protein [Candidatus Krumholzibacteriota bacterium]|nr:CvpA family protein [Candidatus Krumholzibacteriota bacterium]
MDIIRIVIGIVLLIFFIIGLKRGLIRQVLEVLGLIAAFIGSFYLAHFLAVFMENRVDLSYRIALIVSAIVIFVGIIILFYFIGISLQKLFKMTILGSFDRLMGGVFGAVKGILLISLVLVIILSIPVDWDFKDQIREDPVTGAIYPVLPVLFDLVVSRSGLEFNSVAQIEKLDGIEKAIRNAEKYKDALEKEKKTGND